MNISNLNDEAIIFLDKMFIEIKRNQVNLYHWEIDHLCYRSSSIDHYNMLKKSFRAFSTLLSEVEINGRPISTFKLSKPIFYKDYTIDLIEIPAPKPGKEIRSGFEHFELVVDVSFDQIISAYPNSTFKKTGMTKVINPELQMTLESGAIKFHHSSLEYVINIENSMPVMSFLENSQILERLASYKPLISGSYPLNIATRESDLDILFQSKNLNLFKSDVMSLFSDNDSLIIKEKRHQDISSLIISLKYNELVIELFCQNKDVYRQQSNLHFLIEGRLLKLFPKIQNKIHVLKKSGIKTEPAFGEVFDLTAPYEELLELQLKSDKELRTLYQHLC